MIDILLAFLTLGLKPLYDKNIAYYRIIEEFKNKLPRPQKQAKKLSEKEKEQSQLLAKSLKNITVLDVSYQRVNIDEATIDEFYNKLNNFNFNWIVNKAYYQKFTQNLNRFDPSAEDKSFDLAMIQLIIKEDPLRPLKPWAVFKYHLKWKYKFSSKIYGWIKKKYS